MTSRYEEPPRLGRYEPIYSESLSGEALQNEIDAIVAAQTLAARTVLNPEDGIADCAGHLDEVVIVGVPDWGNAPDFLVR